MKKSIFLFFAAILCAMTANAQWYLRGSFNGWGTSHQFVNNVCEIELPAGASYEFKVADANWNTGYGYPEITSTSTKTQNGGGNTTFKTGLPGIYKFEISSDAKQLTVTYPEVPAPHDITVRAQVPAHWTNTITAWVWTSENGDGEEVTPTKDGDYYVVTKNAGALYVIFKNGAGWNGDKNQTVDLCYTEDVCLQLNQSNTAKATATVIDCGAVSKDITVKAVVPGAWENTITAWVWPTGGEEKEVTPTKDGNWYVVTENCIELNVIFKNGTGWNGNENQTANIEGVSENTCYQISALNKDGDGKCTYTVVDCEAAIEPEVKPEDIYTVVGSSAELGLEWNPAKEANDMEKQGDGSYKKVYSNVELTSDVEWKIAKNDDWWNGPTFNQSNNTLTIAQSGIYNVTFTLSADLATATATAELLEATNTVADCFISGNAALTGGAGWAGNEFKMEYDPATETYSYTLTGLAAETAYELQVVLGGNWYGYEKLQTIPTGVENKEGHIAFTLAEAGDVTITYHATNGINLTGNFAVPVTYDYYIAGTENLTGFNWSANGLGMTKEGDVYKHTFTELNAGEYEFKITDGQWNTNEDKTHEWGYSNLGAAYEEVSEGTDGEGNPNGNIKITLAAEKEITVIFDATADKITFEDLTEKVIEYGVTFNVTVPVGTEACYICGEWDWNTFKPMTKVDDTHYTLTIDDATKDHKYKYTFGEAWTYVEKNADGSDVQNRTWTENDVVAAWADPLATNIYLAGSMTDWDNGRIEFMKATPDATIATVAVELPVGDNTFKIMNGDTWLGNGGIVENSITGWSFKEGEGDCTLKATYAATYVFTWDLTKEEQQLSVTYPTVETRDYPSVTKSLFNGWRISYTELNLGNYNTITIYNHDGTAFTYGDDFEVTASLEVNLEGTGSWKVDGDNEVLTATLYNEEKTAIYLITASTAAPKTYTLTCTDAQYASTAYGTVFTGTADGKVLMIDVSMMQVGENEAFGICSWNDIEISSNLATVTKVGDKYSLTGDFTDAAGNTYKVTITDATPKPATELTVTGATFTESAWGSVNITGVWGSEELGATLGSAEFGDQDWGVEIWTETIYLTPIGSVNFAQADDGVSVVLKGQFSDANANPYNVSITGTLVEYVTPVVEFGDGDNATAINDYSWQIVDAKIKRTFVAEDGWYTLCVPFGMDASLIGEAYEITSINKNDKTQGIDVTFSEVDYLLAGNPYLIKPTATVTDPVIEGVEIEYTTGEEYTVTGDGIKITMTGIINGGGTTNGTTEYYVGADGYLYNGEVDKLGLRALFTITDLAGNATRVRARVVTGENATTGVDDTFTTDVPVKAIENGQLIIIRDGVKYNVQGQKL